MNIFIKFVLLGCVITNLSFANNMVVNANLGVSQNQNAFYHDGQSNMARLGIGYVANHFPNINLGLEFGIQNGNSFRLAIAKPIINAMGGVPIQAQLKPIIDGLLTINCQQSSSSLVYGILKTGLAYRELQVDRETVNDLSKFAPEVQAGIGYRITKNTQLQLVYQQIFSSDFNFQLNSEANGGQINHIPPQQAVFIGISTNLS